LLVMISGCHTSSLRHHQCHHHYCNHLSHHHSLLWRISFVLLKIITIFKSYLFYI